MKLACPAQKDPTGSEETSTKKNISKSDASSKGVGSGFQVPVTKENTASSPQKTVEKKSSKVTIGKKDLSNNIEKVTNEKQQPQSQSEKNTSKPSEPDASNEDIGSGFQAFVAKETAVSSPPKTVEKKSSKEGTAKRDLSNSIEKVTNEKQQSQSESDKKSTPEKSSKNMPTARKRAVQVS